jgi:uncharacterized membrane-anchored protein YitT (DUF2179 family)
MDVGKILIVLGGLILLIGILIQIGLPIGKLPGDIKVVKGNVTVYAPLMTGLVLSIVLTIVLNFLLKNR